MAAVQIAINSWKAVESGTASICKLVRVPPKDAQQTLESAVREHPDDAEAMHAKRQLPILRCLPTTLQIFRQLLSIYEQLKDSKGQYYCHRRLAMHPVVGYTLDGAEPVQTCARCSLALQHRPRRLRAPVRVAHVARASRDMSNTGIARYAALLLSEDRVREAREQLSQAPARTRGASSPPLSVPDGSATGRSSSLSQETSWRCSSWRIAIDRCREAQPFLDCCQSGHARNLEKATWKKRESSMSRLLFPAPSPLEEIRACLEGATHQPVQLGGILWSVSSSLQVHLLRRWRVPLFALGKEINSIRHIASPSTQG